MSQTADLEHLFQLEQILSIGSILGEWSDYCDDSNDSANKVENKCTSQNESVSSATDPYDNSTTSFDPGGDSEKPTKIDGGEKMNEDSEINYSKKIRDHILVLYQIVSRHLWRDKKSMVVQGLWCFGTYLAKIFSFAQTF